MKLTVLGCGDAFGSNGRFNTSFLIQNDKEGILLDCGATTLVRLKQEQIDLSSISTIIISHFHGDHFGGLPFILISRLFESVESSPLTIIGPKGIKEKTIELQEVLYPGTSQQLDQLVISFREFDEGKSLVIDEKKVEVYGVIHSPPSLPHAIRLTWQNKIIAFSGDTSWTDKLIPLAKGADIFICECNFMEPLGPGHLSYQELFENQSSFECKQMFLSHMNSEVIHSSAVQMNKLEDGLQIVF